jgi:hypothetical protein
VLRTTRLMLRGWLPADRAPFAALNAVPANVAPRRVMEELRA